MPISLVPDTVPSCGEHMTCGTGFIREGGIPGDEHAGDVLASSRMNSVPQDCVMQQDSTMPLLNVDSGLLRQIAASFYI